MFFRYPADGHMEWTLNSHAPVNRNRALENRPSRLTLQLMRCHLLPVVLAAAVLALAANGGCHDNESSSPRSLASEPSASKTIDSPQSLATGPLTLTTAQTASLKRVRDAGGSIECDRDGYPVTIDLASDRVSASDDVLGAVLEFPHLRRLRLAVSNTTNETLSRLASLHELHELLLQDAPLTDRDLALILGAMPQLERLTLRRLSQVTDAITTTLKSLSQLQVLAMIEMNRITGATLEQLSAVPKLRSLDVRDCGGLTAQDMTNLVKLHGLSELKLGGPMINDDVLVTVAELPALTSLVIEDAQVSGECLQRVATVPALASRLSSLSMARCFGVSDETLVALGRFPQLETLVLRDILITGTFLTRLSETRDEPTAWTTLVVQKGFLDDAAVRVLPQLAPQLTRLDLRGNVNVTDQSLEVFRQLRHLQALQLSDTGVTDPGRVEEEVKRR